MHEQPLPKKAVMFCAACVLFVGSLYYFVKTARENAEALTHRTVPLELQDLVGGSGGI